MDKPQLNVIAPTMDDYELVTRIRAGEAALFELLMRRLNRRMFLTARSILLSDQEAEEAVQDAYVRGWQRLDQFRGPDGVGAWFARIVRNEALMRLRRRVGLEDVATSEVVESVVDERLTPAQEVEAMELRTILEQAIDQLPQPFRTTYVLREVEQLSVEETAACLDIDPGTVKTRVHRARKMLRDNLQQGFAMAVTEAFPFQGARCDRIVREVMARIGPDPMENSRTSGRDDATDRLAADNFRNSQEGEMK